MQAQFVAKSKKTDSILFYKMVFNEAKRKEKMVDYAIIIIITALESVRAKAMRK